MNRIPRVTAGFPAGLLTVLLVLPLGGMAPPSRQASSRPSAVAHLSGRAASRMVLHAVRPQYPPVARLNYIQGKVKLRVLVDREGSVRKVHVLQGQPLLAAAAFKAVRKWVYRPFRSANGPETFSTDVNVKFSLHSQTATDLPLDAEEFLNQQVHPPQVLKRPPESAGAEQVRLRVLVDSDGKVLDSTPVGATAPRVEAARRNVRRWKFRSARWGTIAIPWYVRVEVPAAGN